MTVSAAIHQLTTAKKGVKSTDIEVLAFSCIWANCHLFWQRTSIMKACSFFEKKCIIIYNCPLLQKHLLQLQAEWCKLQMPPLRQWLNIRIKSYCLWLVDQVILDVCFLLWNVLHTFLLATQKIKSSMTK